MPGEAQLEVLSARPSAAESGAMMRPEAAGSGGVASTRSDGMKLLFVRVKENKVAVAVVCGVVVLLTLAALTQGPPSKSGSEETRQALEPAFRVVGDKNKPKVDYKNGIFRIAIIADMDIHSRIGNEAKWRSLLRVGTLIKTGDPAPQAYRVVWHEEVQLVGKLSEGFRGMELSELLMFNDRLYTVDDRTGVVYEIIDKTKAIPRYFLTDGDGTSTKGFKGEWMTVWNGNMVVGSMGKEWASATGGPASKNPQYVKTITKDGQISSEDWSQRYNTLRQKTGTAFPGYLLHEAVMHSDHHSKWFFLPRRASKEAYDEAEDEHRGTNMLLSIGEDFNPTGVGVTFVGTAVPELGYSSGKFIPGTEDREIVALKTKEVEDSIASYISVFSVDGEVLMDDKLISNVKFEGVEFVDTY